MDATKYGYQKPDTRRGFADLTQQSGKVQGSNWELEDK
jgi:hypothetical protein